MPDEIQKHKLWVSGMSPDRTESEVRSFCEEFGPFIHMNRTRNKTDVFLTYLSEQEAAEALLRFKSGKIKANYAFNKQTHRSTLSSSSSNQNGTSLHNSSYSKNDRRVHFSNGIELEKSNVHSTGTNVKNGSAEENQNEEKLDAPKTVFRNGDEIVITHITNDFQFYAHLQSQSGDYDDLIQTVSKLAKDADELDEIPNPGSFVFAQHNGEYWRALVLSSSQTKNVIVTVKLVDVGIKVEVPFHRLRKMYEEFTEVNIKLTFSFLLNDIEEGVQCSYALEYFKSFIGTELKIESNRQIVEPKTKVTLIEPVTKRNINRLVQQCMQRFTIDTLNKHPAPKGKNQLLILVDDSKLLDGYNLITFIQREHSNEFQKQLNQIQMVANIFEKYPPYEPSDDELCLVKYDEHWHRAVLQSLDKTQNNAIVYLVDLQKGIEVDLADIRKINEDIAILPILTFTAAAEDFENRIDKGNIRYLLNKLKANDIVCDIQDGPLGDDICLFKF